jgi:aldehyde:ferredoxin oxidoreductase
MYGWHGIALKVDLTKKEITRWPIPTEFLEKFIGGEALGTRLLYEFAPPGAKALSPENPFIIAAGPMSGTLVPGASRVEVVTKSPLTGILGDSSAGGFFIPQVRWAGYDAIIITGRSEKPVWLFIKDDDVELRDASHIWGKPHLEAAYIVKEEVNEPEMQTLSIGPAAENLVCFCPVFCDTNAAAWTSPGTVLGYKKLKLIGARGTKGIKPKEPDRFMREVKAMHEHLLKSWGYPERSTGGVLRTTHPRKGEWGMYGLYNYQEGWLSDEDRKKVDYRAFSRIKVKNMACALCPLHCKSFVHIKEGPYAGMKYKGIEFWPTELYPSCGIIDNEFNVKITSEADKYGLCVAHLSFAIQFAMELWQRGIIQSKDTGGLDLTWGNKEAIFELARMITNREGFGDVLADGYVRAAEKIGRGADRYLCTINGLPAMLNPRFFVQKALCNVTSTSGPHMFKGDDAVGWIVYPKYLGQNELLERIGRSLEGYEFTDLRAFNPNDPYGKVGVTIWNENVSTIGSSLEVCLFCTWRHLGTPGIPESGGIRFGDYPSVLEALTGLKYDVKGLYECGERMWRLEMAYNAREGLRREHFKLPPRFTKDAVTKGPLKGIVVDEELLDKMLDQYLELRGFDPKTALPTEKGLVEVGLEDIAADFKKLGLLA